MNTKIILKTFSGENLKYGTNDLTLGKAISDIVINAKAQDKLKAFILAEKFYKNEVVELDIVDLNLVKDFIRTSDIFNNLVTGQLLNILENENK